jgi:CDP-diacylglycerol--serine O-phosphatidyltransferase
MEMPLLAFKFKTFGWKENQIKYIFLGLSVLLLFLLKFAAVPLIVGLYILLSVIAPKPPKGA